MSLSWEKRLASLMLLLALLLSLMLPCFALAEDSDAQLDPTRWGNAADRIDRYADTAFALYMAGDFAKAYSNVSDAYFQVYEITGFERQTLSYISGPRKNAVEL
ncbi:MAG: hypothetical protein IJ229_09895, partial [Clostridia bacterium]|nr:hypothetical protein [Clostridia bacterium]